MAKSKKVKTNQMRSRIPNSFVGLIVFFLFIAQIVFANSLSAKGREIKEFEFEKRSLWDEQIKLRESLADLGSLERIGEDAKRIGMIEGGENFDYLVPPKVAYNP